MEYSNQFYDAILENMLNAFAYHKIITDESNKPIDYEFIDINLQFEKLTGLKRDNIIGKRATEVLPGIEASEFNWIEVYGNIAQNGLSERFTQYSSELGKWYFINAYSFQKNYFVTIFNDVTDLKLKEKSLMKQNIDLLASEDRLKRQCNEQKLYAELNKANEERLNKAQEMAHVGNWELDLDSKVIWASEEAFKIYGIQRKTPFIRYEEIKSLVNSIDRPRLDLALELLIKNNARYDLEFRITNASSNEERIIHSVAENKFNEVGKLVKIIGVLQDITERKKIENELKLSYEETTSLFEQITASEETLKEQYDELKNKQNALRISEERFRLAAEGAQDVIVDWDFRKDVLHLSDRWQDITGYKNNVIRDPISRLKEIIYREDFKIFEDNLSDILEGKIPLCSFEFRIIISDGSIKWLLNRGVVRLDSDGRPVRYAGSITDISERKKSEEHINYLAYNDSVTGLSNRTLFINRLERSVSAIKNGSLPGAVLFLDLDDFKKINDTYGHSTGDKLLKDVGLKLKACLREYDTIARIGGDEFTILLTNINKYSSVLECADRILKIFNTQWNIDTHEIYITASMGVTVFPNDGNNVRDLMKNADTAMYYAKEKGKNNYQFFEKSMLDKIMYKVMIEKDLRNALHKEELIIYYQPQVNISTGKIECMEALIRWNHPKRGMMPPIKFIPIAEETSIIIRIGEWVLREACYQNKMWQKQGFESFSVAVNISLVQLHENTFVKMVKDILKETGLKPELLELEITETILIESMEATIKKLQELKDIGVKISLDDFGKGYSSLNYLRLLPIDTLKIDKSFVDDIEVLEQNQLFIKQIIEIAHVLKLNVTAEGVETERQFEYLRNEKCDKVQGYFFSKPLPADKIMDIINNSPLQL